MKRYWIPASVLMLLSVLVVMHRAGTSRGPFSSRGERSVGQTGQNGQTPLLRRYGHAVVPAGVPSVASLRHVISSDPLAARHYSGFDVDRAHIVRLRYDLVAYVSYRTQDGIFWRTKSTVIPAGEPLISDGSNYIRARCGNRISYVPQAPINPDEPNDTDLIETPAVPEAPPLLLTAVAPPLIQPPSAPPGTPSLPSFPVTEVAPPMAPSTLTFTSHVPFVPVLFPIPIPGPRPSVGPEVGVPVVDAPEPGTFSLLMIGLVALLIWSRRRRCVIARAVFRPRDVSEV